MPIPIDKLKRRRKATATILCATQEILDRCLEMNNVAGDLIIDPESEDVFWEVDTQLACLGEAAAAVRKAIE